VYEKQLLEQEAEEAQRAEEGSKWQIKKATRLPVFSLGQRAGEHSRFT
jgi:hypothetical protein